MRHLQRGRTKKLSARSRIPAAIGIALFVAMTGCGEPTGPRTFCCAPKPEQTVTDLSVLTPELHDAADIFVEGVADSTLRAQTELAVTRLGDQLQAGKVTSSRTALAQARSLQANLVDLQAIELGPVALALDYIERRINEILTAGGYGG